MKGEDMADLIDRQAVIDLLKKNTTRDIEEVVVTEKNIKLIMDMPKAYDVDAVVGRIRRSSGNGYRDIDGDWVPPMIETKNAIDIVKAGGING
jgi:predicted component of type VI protein secretion system